MIRITVDFNGETLTSSVLLIRIGEQIYSLTYKLEHI